MTQEQLKSVPSFPQAQYSLNEQLEQLIMVANRVGLRDAADYIQANLDRRVRKGVNS